MLHACRLKLLCASLVIPLTVAQAQQLHRAALGNAAAAKQRSAKFLAERGIVPGRSQLTLSPAQMLIHARAQFRPRAQQTAVSSTQVPAWQPVGPAQVITSAYGAISGHITSIAADPSDSTGNTIYVGTASGGVWKSINAAGDPSSVTLVPLTDSVFSSISGALPSLSIGSVSVQPVSAGTAPVILAGTGNPNDTTASYFGSGILRSTDGGNQWTQIIESSDRNNGSQSNYSFIGNGFSGFAWGNVSGNPVVVAGVSQVQQSVEVYAGANQPNILGIYYSTDLGQTWFMATITDPSGIVQSPQVSFAACVTNSSRQPCGNAITTVVWNPIRKLFFAAVRFHGFYQSSDGQNWTRLASQPGANLTTSMCPRNEGNSGSSACPIYNAALAVQPVTGDTFALTTDINNLDQGLWQDTCQLSSGSCASSILSFAQIPDNALDAGSLNPSEPTEIPQADYDLYLAAVPSQQSSQPDTLLFAGTADIYRCDLAAGCAWRNTTHAQSSDCNSAHVAPAQYALDATFASSGLLYFGNDGGIWRSTDAVNQQQPQCSADDATHFQNLNFAFTGSIAEVEDLALDVTNPQNMMVSLGPLGTADPFGAAGSWQQVLDGEGDYAAIDPFNSQNWYATSEFGIGINRCDQGSSCSIASFGLPVINSVDAGNDGYGQIIPSPWILDPQNSANLILGTCRVWRGPASGGPQTPLSGMLDGDNNPYCDGNAEIRSLAASGKSSDASGTPETIYAGMAGLFDGGATVAGHVFSEPVGSNAMPSSWIDLSYNLNNFNPNGYDISSIYVDPHSQNGQTVYVTLQGFDSVAIYRSTDGGSIWQDLSYGLPGVPANSAIVDPNDANTVYLATDAGVFYTHDISSCGQPSSSCWSILGSSLPDVPVTQLSAISTPSGPALLAATYGRGVWQLALPSTVTSSATASPTSLTFANQPVGTASAPQQVLITNTGNIPLQIGSLAMSGDFTESDTCSGESIAPGDACIIEVLFVPQQAATEGGLLTVYANLTSGQLTIPLSGTGTAGAAVTLTPSSLCFQPTLIGQTTSSPCGSAAPPSQPAQSGQLIVIANTGGSAVSLTSVSVTGDFSIVSNTCGASLAPANQPNDSCTISIAFKPTASGSRTGYLTAVDSTGTQVAQLIGTGQAAATDILSSSNLTFATQAIGSVSPPQQITLTNNGDQALQGIIVESSSTDFNATNDCGATLAGHSSCAIIVTFLPATIGPQSASLIVNDIISQGTSSISRSQSIALSGTGIAPLNTVSATPFSLDFGYYALNQTSPVQNVTLTNNGTFTISGIRTAIAGDFDLQPASSNPCGTDLAANSACNIGVVFSPTQVNRRAGSVTITGSGLPIPLVVALSGSGAAFTMKVMGSSSQVITGDETPQPFQLEIDPVNGSTGPVKFTCTVVPSNASCTLSPASVTLTGANSQSAAVTFTAGPQAHLLLPAWKQPGPTLAMLLPLGIFGVRRRKWFALALCAFLVLLLPVGCGVASSSGGTSSTGSSGSSPVSATQYTLIVTGSMPGVTQTVAMQVTTQ